MCVPLDCDDPANQDLLLQKQEERIEKLSQQDKLSKFCADAGFHVVEIGQYFRTKDTAHLSQFHAVICRGKKHHNQKGGSQGTQRFDPYQKLQPVSCMAKMKLRSEFGR